MAFLSDVFAWFTTSAHWTGDDGIVHRAAEHLVMSGAATTVAVLVGLPLGLLLGHRARGGTVAINVANVGRALPSFGILVLATQVIGLRGWPGFGARPAFIALVALGVPPVLTNTYVGVRGVDAAVVDAARGMGLSPAHVVRRVELPLAVPVVMAGVRTAAVQIVATATLAAVVAWGGLGRFVVDGLSRRDSVQVFAGAVLVAALAIAVEFSLGVVQRLVTPAGSLVGPTTADVVPSA